MLYLFLSDRAYNDRLVDEKIERKSPIDLHWHKISEIISLDQEVTEAWAGLI